MLRVYLENAEVFKIMARALGLGGLAALLPA